MVHNNPIPALAFIAVQNTHEGAGGSDKSTRWMNNPIHFKIHFELN